MQRHAHRRLSATVDLFHVDFYSATHADGVTAGEGAVRVEVLADGWLTAVCLSFDLDLYPGAPRFSTAPEAADLVAWDQTLRFLPIQVGGRCGNGFLRIHVARTQVGVKKGQVLHLHFNHDNLHTSVGIPNVTGCPLGLGHMELLGKTSTREGGD